jgi:hypothetical protein
MLNTERNTQTMERRVLAAARKSNLSTHPRLNLRADFEHGQWWITDRFTGAQWSACDAVGASVINGFSFEQVTEGEEL